ncbi:MAG: helix-turn-helix transcriptional regulator, partial [Actinomycetota bacterium]|nr:helix-turn-helix transcriptional regulator [Actinomycetota bacterium]
MVPSYQEDEALAWTLDLIGERWTLLIVRDLLLGPARFTDLSQGLPRLSRNLLTARLRRLEEEGLVQRRQLPPPAATQVYEITEEGWSLARIVAPLSVWGLRRLGPELALAGFRASTFAIGMVAFADPAAAEGIDHTCQFDIDGESFHIRIEDGSIRPHRGPAAKPDVVVNT